MQLNGCNSTLKARQKRSPDTQGQRSVGPRSAGAVNSTRELRLSCMGGGAPWSVKQNGRRVAPTAVLVSMAGGFASGGALLEALQ
jgi:hypothetical protein